VQRLLVHLKKSDRQVSEVEGQSQAWHRAHDLSRALEKIPSIDRFTVSVLVVLIGDAKHFANNPKSRR
jgi:transposase